MSESITEADVLKEIVAAQVADYSPQVARALLKLRFNDDATRRIRRLLQKNNRGTISATERVTLEKYLRVGQFLDLVHAMAKVSLNKR